MVSVFFLQYVLEPLSERLKHELILTTALSSLHIDLQVNHKQLT
jgi:hypothetical protein